MEDILVELKELINRSTELKKKLNNFTSQSIRKIDSVLLRKLLHYVIIMETIPDRRENETDFDYNSRLLQLKRRILSENNLAEVICTLLKI